MVLLCPDYSRLGISTHIETLQYNGRYATCSKLSRVTLGPNNSSLVEPDDDKRVCHILMSTVTKTIDARQLFHG